MPRCGERQASDSLHGAAVLHTMSCWFTPGGRAGVTNAAQQGRRPRPLPHFSCLYAGAQSAFGSLWA